VMGLALFSQSSYEEVMRMLVTGHAWSSGWAQEWCRRRVNTDPLAPSEV